MHSLQLQLSGILKNPVRHRLPSLTQQQLTQFTNERSFTFYFSRVWFACDHGAI